MSVGLEYMWIALRRENCNFDGVLQDKSGSTETATGILWVLIRACHGYGYGHICRRRR